MSYRIFNSNRTALFLLLVIGIMLMSSGCSDRVYDDQYPNQRPVVDFVNIPPDGHRVSVNPVVHWVGTDVDGLITTYRYIVVAETEMGGLTPGDYATTTLLTRPASDWTYLEVTVDDPQTTNVIPASANIDDPVASYVRQYIFVQAFDDQGMASLIKFKLVLRNDFPPDTRIYSVDSSRVHINDEQPGAVGTGVYPRWEATDPDIEDSLFQFEWYSYGPYQDPEWDTLVARYMKCVFLTNDARLYRIGEGEVIFYFDTTFGDSGMEIDTTMIIVDTIQGDNFYGTLDCEFLDIWDTVFAADTTPFMIDTDAGPMQVGGLYRPIDSSWDGSDTWVEDERDSLWDLFRHIDTDSTIVRKFIFTTRCRDGASVVDLNASWTTFYAVEPRYEREVIIIDFNKALGRTNAPYIFVTDTMWNGQPAPLIQDYWKNVVDVWAAQAGIPNFDFDLDEDYVMADFVGRRVDLKRLLQHKMMILYNDDILPSGITDGLVPSSNLGANIYIAIDAGVNAFLTMRAPITGGQTPAPQDSIVPDASYQRYFGCGMMVYSGWGYWAFDVNSFNPNNRRQMMRIEDFVGAFSMQDQSPWPEWPDIAVDSNQLHNRYYWSIQFGVWGHPFQWGGRDSVRFDTIPFPYIPLPDDVRALPEVDWASRNYGTEVMYLYRSYYEGAHPLGESNNFHGAPVAHRNNAGVFKTVHFSFTPPSITDADMQPILNDVLDWLYSSNLGSPPTDIRYPDAQNPMSMSEARDEHWRRYYDAMEPEQVMSVRQLR